MTWVKTVVKLGILGVFIVTILFPLATAESSSTQPAEKPKFDPFKITLSRTDSIPEEELRFFNDSVNFTDQMFPEYSMW